MPGWAVLNARSLWHSTPNLPWQAVNCLLMLAKWLTHTPWLQRKVAALAYRLDLCCKSSQQRHIFCFIEINGRICWSVRNIISSGISKKRDPETSLGGGGSSFREKTSWAAMVRAGIPQWQGVSSCVTVLLTCFCWSFFRSGVQAKGDERFACLSRSTSFHWVSLSPT